MISAEVFEFDPTFQIGRHNYAFDLLTKYLENVSFWGMYFYGLSLFKFFIRQQPYLSFTKLQFDILRNKPYNLLY